MELIVVMLAVGASAIYLVRRFWRAFTNSADNACCDGCSGCACTSTPQAPPVDKKDPAVDSTASQKP